MKKIFGLERRKTCLSSSSSCGDGGSGYPLRDRDLGKIHRAASRGNVAKVQQILLLGENGVNDKDKKNRTALHLACANGHAEVVTLLVERKCQLNLYDSEHRTALMKAVQCEKEECVSILLQHGADPNIMDTSGNTALHYAVRAQHTSIAVKLLSYNANTEARNKDDFTPLLLAVNENKQQMVEFLGKKEANIHAVGKAKSSGQLISEYKEEKLHKNSSQNNNPGVEEHCEADFLKRLSNKPGIDDSWPTSDEQYFSFDTKTLPTPSSIKLMTAYQQFRKNKENLSIVRPENRTLLEDNSSDSKHDEDVVETLPKLPVRDQGLFHAASPSPDPLLKPALESSAVPCATKVEERKKHKRSEKKVSENSDVAAAEGDDDGFLQQRQSEKTYSQQFPIKDNDSNRSSPALHMKEVKKNENEKWTSKEPVIAPRFEKTDSLTGFLLQVNHHSRLSEIDQEEERTAKKTSDGKNKVKKQITSVDDLHGLTQSFEMSSDDSEFLSPNCKNSMLLIEQLRKVCKDSVSLLKIQDAILSYERLIDDKKNHCELLRGKIKTVKNEVSILQKELSETKEMKSQLEHQKVEWELKLHSLRFALKQEQEKRRNADMLYDKIREQLRRNKKQYNKEVEMKQQLEFTLQTVNMELRTVRIHLNQAVEERNDIQRQLSQQKDRILQDGIQTSYLCEQKDTETAQKKSQVAVRQLQQELADTLQKLSMSEASLEVTSHAHIYLEDETKDLKKKLSQIRSQLQEVQAQHTEAVQHAERTQDHMQKFEIENMKLKATIKKQMGKIEQLQKNLLGTNLSEEEKEQLKKLTECKESLEHHLDQEMKKNGELEKQLIRLKKLLKLTRKKLNEYENGEHSFLGDLKPKQIEMDSQNTMLKHQIDDLTGKLETSSSKCLHLDAKNQDLQQELLSMKTIEKKCEELEEDKKKLEQEVVNLKNLLEMNMLEHGQIEQCKREIEERARQEIEQKLREVNQFLQIYAGSQENLEQLRENNNAAIIQQMELRIKDLESQLLKMKISLDVSYKPELKRYKHLYLEEEKVTTSLSKELNETKEKLADSNTKLLMEERRNGYLVSLLTVTPVPEPSWAGNLNNYSVLSRSLIPRENIVITSSVQRPSCDSMEGFLTKLLQDFEKNITEKLQEAEDEIASTPYRISLI